MQQYLASSFRPRLDGIFSPWAAWWTEAAAQLRLALPLALGELSFVVITTTDLLMMGWLGPEPLAAGSLGLNTLWLFLFFSFGVISAVGPLCAQALGARSPRAVRRTFRQGFWVALCLSVPTVLVLWQCRWILIALGQDPALAALAEPYMRALVFGLPAAFCTAVLWEFCAAHSRPRAPMVLAGLGIGVNAVADYFLMFGFSGWPGLGLVGAGVASALVNWFIFLSLLTFVLRDRRFRRYRVAARFWRPDWPRFREIFSVGTPLGLGFLAEMGFFATTTFLVGRLGAEALAAHAIALQLTGVAIMIPSGLSQAATVRVGYAVGARTREAIGQAGWTALGLGTVYMVLVAVVFLLFGQDLVGLFLDQTGGPEVVAMGGTLLLIAAGFQVFDGGQTILHGALIGLKDTRAPMILAIFGYWGIGVAAAWGLSFHGGLGAPGVWFGVTAALAVVFTLMLLRWRQRLVAIAKSLKQS
ncbi:MAG: MATE family efflux transporter [Pseudomonadota bacterium]